VFNKRWRTGLTAKGVFNISKYLFTNNKQILGADTGSLRSRLQTKFLNRPMVMSGKRII